MRRTPHYKLEYLLPGDVYSAGLDFRRMATLDYNLNKYVGFIGDGIIRGWELSSSIGSMVVSISAGAGFVDGKILETPFSKDPLTGLPKRKSQINPLEETVFDYIPGYSDPRPESYQAGFYLLGGEPPESVLIAKSFGPQGEDLNEDGENEVLRVNLGVPPEEYLHDPFVKAFNRSKHQVVLPVDPTDVDYYVYAFEEIGGESGSEVKFHYCTTEMLPPAAILLGRVKVRESMVSSIDYSESRRLSNMQGVIADFSKDLITNHRHGGGRSCDPPLVNLKTDLRRCFPINVNSNKKTITFQVYASQQTGVSDGHRHTYKMSGSIGTTEDIIGDYPFHMHDLQLQDDGTVSVGAPVGGYGSAISNHVHAVASSHDTWDENSPIRVRVNGQEVDKKYYQVNSVSKTITLPSSIASFRYPVYEMSFKLDETRTYKFRGSYPSLKTFIYAAEINFYSLYNEEIYPTSRHNDEIAPTNPTNADPTYQAPTQTPKATLRDPFAFFLWEGKNAEQLLPSGFVICDPVPVNVNPVGYYLSDGEPSGVRSSEPYISSLSAVASNLLKKSQDKIQLIPWVARFVDVTLIQPSYCDEVTVEVLEESDVSGILRPESILFVDASKLATGIFSPSRIPFLEHIGRMGEEALPAPATLYTEDRIAFYGVPTYTDSTLGHRHKVFLDRNLNGATVATIVGDRLSVYADKNGEYIGIAHSHGVSNGKISSQVAKGVNQWKEVDSQTSHSHYLSFSSTGNSKTVYAYNQDSNGNRFFATSDGLICCPNGLAYSIYINKSLYKFFGITADEALKLALKRHADGYGETVEISYPELIPDAISPVNVNEGSVSISGVVVSRSVLYSGITESDLPKPLTINIISKSEFVLDDICVYAIRDLSSLSPQDEILKTFEVLEKASLNFDSGLGALLSAVKDADSAKAISKAMGDSPQESPPVKTVYWVRRSYNGETIWSILSDADGNGLYVLTAKSLLYRDMRKQTWSSFCLPPGVNVLRKIIRSANGNILIATDSGVISLVPDMMQKSLKTLPAVSSYRSVMDLVESSVGDYPWLLAASNGIYLSKDGGMSWEMRQFGSSIQFLSRDYSLDLASENLGHIHYLIVDQYGNGTTTDPFNQDESPFQAVHIHDVRNWIIKNAIGPEEHSHVITSTIYGVDEGGDVYRSEDSGVSWLLTGKLPLEYGEIGELFAAFGNLYLASEKGMLISDDCGSTWSKTVIPDKIHSFEWDRDLLSFIVGGEDVVYQSGGQDFKVIKKYTSTVPRRILLDRKMQYFGYAFNNLTAGFFFLQKPPISMCLEGLLSQSLWSFPRGGWSNNVDYQIFVNKSKIIDTIIGKDESSLLPYNFIVNPDVGEVNIGTITSLVRSIDPGDDVIFVQSTNKIVPQYPITIIQQSGDSIQSSEAGAGDANKKLAYQSRFIRVEVEAISGSEALLLKNPFLEKLSLPAIVIQEPKTEETLSIQVNVYDSALLESGVLSHEDVEDSFYREVSGMPYSMSNSGYYNLSELTLKLKTNSLFIDKGFRNWRSYMMNYSAETINNYFNVFESIFRSGSFLNTSLTPLKPSSINSIEFGMGDFKGLMAIGTDVGLFLSVHSGHWRDNWFWASTSGRTPVNGVLFLPSEYIYLATDQGVFRSDFQKWQKISMAGNLSKFVSFRWRNFGSPDENLWWKSWNGLENRIDPDLTNTLIAGGKDYASYSFDNGITWQGSDIDLPNNSSFLVQGIVPLQIGKALMLINQIALPSGETESRILATAGYGLSWDLNVFESKEQRGVVFSTKLTDQNNTELTVSSNLESYAPDNHYCGAELVAKGKSWTIISNSDNKIVVYDSLAHDLLLPQTPYSIKPLCCSDATETSERHILLATDNGIWTDHGGYRDIDEPIATIQKINKSATVESIDLSGDVRLVSLVGDVSSEDKKTVLTCELDHYVSADELVGRRLIFRTTSVPVISILSPTPNQSIEGSSVRISVSVIGFEIGSNGFIRSLLDGSTEMYHSRETFTLLGVPPGSHTLDISLVDINKVQLSNLESSKSIVFTTDYSSVDPSVQIIYPAQNQSIFSGPFRATIKVSNFVTGVDGNLFYSLDSAASVFVPAFGTGSVEVEISPLTPGTHNLRAFLATMSGSDTGVSASNNFVVTKSDVPSIFLVSPRPGSTILTDTLSVNYVVSNFDIGPSSGKVKITIDGSSVFYSTNQTSILIGGLSDGRHSLVARLVDSNGSNINYSTAITTTVSFAVNTSVVKTPSISVSYPYEGQVVSETANINVLFNILNYDKSCGVWIGVNSGAEVYLPIDNTFDTISYTIQGLIGDVVSKPMSVKITLAENQSTRLPIYATRNFLISKSGSRNVDLKTEFVNTITPSFNSTENLFKSTTSPEVSSGRGGSSSNSLSGMSLNRTEPNPDETSNSSMGWSILSNTLSSVDGTVAITISGHLQRNSVGNQFVVVGNNSVVYLSFDDPVSTGEFNGGLMVVDPSERLNANKTYEIVSQNENYAIVNASLSVGDGQSSSKDVVIGQKVILIPSNGESTIVVDFWKPIGRNQMADGYALLVSSTPTTYGSSRENNPSNSVYHFSGNGLRTVTLSRGCDIGIMNVGDSFIPIKPMFTQLLPFNAVRTNVEVCHYHEVNLVGKILKGGVGNVNKISDGYVEVMLSYVPDEFLYDVIVLNPSLLRGEKIVFYDPSRPSTIFEEEIHSTASDRIVVRVNNWNHWNISGGHYERISSGFSWIVDARLYGETVSLISTNNEEDTEEYLQEIKHKHLIRSGEISYEFVQGYKDRGYAVSHGHFLSKLVKNVKNIVTNYGNGTTSVAGSSSRIYETKNNGESWSEVINLSNFFKSDTVVTHLTIDDLGNRIVGTGSGLIFAETTEEDSPAALQDPFVSDFLPSSSSSLSSSSSSSSLSSQSPSSQSSLSSSSVRSSDSSLV